MSPSSSESAGAAELPLIDDTIGHYFRTIARRFPAREALVSRHQGHRLTYEQLDRESDRLASALLRSRLLPGDRVAIWAHNCSEWLLLQVATAKVGIVLVNINPAYRVSELEYALNKVGCKMLISMTAYKTSNYLGIIRDLAPELEHCEAGALNATRVPTLRYVVQLGTSDEKGMIRFAELLATGDTDDHAVLRTASTLHSNDPINIQFTSGTTGFPKGATLTHRNILNNGFFIGEAMRLTETDRLCVPVPLYHCFGMVLGSLACLAHGATIVYPSDGFDALAVLETVQAEKCTGLHGVPTMFISELAHPRFSEFDLSSLRTGIMAGSPCPIEVMNQVVGRMHMAEVTIAYGMTETSPVSCQSSVETPLEKRVSTVGRVHPHLRIKVIDPETAEIVPFDVTGELCTKGYSVMHGYWNDDVKTREAIDQEGWMHTGDLATMDSNGYVNIVGRIKDMVIRGGENVYPREIEEFLYRHPAISDVQVIGVPDKKYGEELCAWIVLKAGQTMSEDDVRMFCKERIAHYKVPRYVKFVDTFPMTITGKIQKFVMRDMMKQELGLTEGRTA
jgi:fatty-acyl-CoA synthase